MVFIRLSTVVGPVRFGASAEQALSVLGPLFSEGVLRLITPAPGVIPEPGTRELLNRTGGHEPAVCTAPFGRSAVTGYASPCSGLRLPTVGTGLGP